MVPVVSRRGVLAGAIGAGALAIAGSAGGILGVSARRAIDGSAVALKAQSVPVAGFALGSNILWLDSATRGRVFDVVVASGVTGVRFDIPWYFVERTRGIYSWGIVDAVVAEANRRGLYVLASIVTTPPWAAVNASGNPQTRPASEWTYAVFAQQVAIRYAGRINAYEIWNEPNASMFFAPAPDANFYTAMVRATYPAIKQIVSVPVVVGAFSPATSGYGVVPAVPFLASMYAVGLKGAFDAVSCHPYDFSNPLAVGAVYDNSPMRQMISMHGLMLAYGDGDKKIWISEYGAPTSRVITADQQHDLIYNSLQQWREVGYAGPMFIHTLRDTKTGSKDPEDNFGVMTSSFVAKKALYGIQALARAGYPTRAELALYSGRLDTSIGKPTAPVYLVKPGYGYGYEFDYGTRWCTNNGFFTSPSQVAAVARKNAVVPIGRFNSGMQDFDVNGGFRIFSGSATGTHAVPGGILTAWSSAMGFPVTDIQSNFFGQRWIDFQRARIAWSQSSGAVVSWF